MKMPSNTLPRENKKPKRSLSAYSFFYKKERARILRWAARYKLPRSVASDSKISERSSINNRCGKGFPSYQNMLNTNWIPLPAQARLNYHQLCLENQAHHEKADLQESSDPKKSLSKDDNLVCSRSKQKESCLNALYDKPSSCWPLVNDMRIHKKDYVKQVGRCLSLKFLDVGSVDTKASWACTTLEKSSHSYINTLSDDKRTHEQDHEMTLIEPIPLSQMVQTIKEVEDELICLLNGSSLLSSILDEAN